MDGGIYLKAESEMQFKALIKNKASQKNIPANAVLQTYLLECILDRVSRSKYSGDFIIKGGILISSLSGITFRTTMDMDATVAGLSLDNEVMKKIVTEICAVPADDNFCFTVDRVESIREENEYSGLRLFLYADYERIHAPLSVDITAGDAITPCAVQHEFTRLFDEPDIHCFVYPLETLLAEKLETIIRRSITNTRSRDFYDVYLLTKLYQNKIDIPVLQTAVKRTAIHRNSSEIMLSYNDQIDAIRNDDIQKTNWERYQQKFPYAATITFDEVCGAVFRLADMIFTEQ
jgi:predicted nucleotidyltransferase component of viral defense system